MWSLRFIETLIQDLRYGARTLMKNPGFTLLAVLTLALGIGSTTTIFSAIQNILLDPFPYKDAHQVVTIQILDTSSGRPGGRSWFQSPEFLDYQEQSRVFEEVIEQGTTTFSTTVAQGRSSSMEALSRPTRSASSACRRNWARHHAGGRQNWARRRSS